MQNFRVFHFQSHDFDEISASLSRWNQTYHQLSAGAFFGDIDYLQTGDMEIFELLLRIRFLTHRLPPNRIPYGYERYVNSFQSRLPCAQRQSTSPAPI